MLLALDVAIGLALTFSLVSLLASLLNEWISGMLRMRGRMLWKTIDDLLGPEMSDSLGQHPFLKGLRQRSWLDKLAFWKMGEQRDAHRNKIGYLPTKTFVRTVMDELKNPSQDSKAGGGPGQAQEPTEAKKKSAPKPAQILPALVREAGGDLEVLEKNLAATFDSAMNEVSSWYKRWSQVTLFVLGLGIAVSVGVDAVVVTQRLATDPDLREAVAQQAQGVLETYDAGQAHEPASASHPPADLSAAPPSQDEAAAGEASPERLSPAKAPGAETSQDEAKDEGSRATSQQVREQIRGLLSTIEGTGLPLIEAPACADGTVKCATWQRRWGRHWKDHWPGFLLTALATCFGAAFWFDLLKRLVNLRVSFKPPGTGPSDAEEKPKP